MKKDFPKDKSECERPTLESEGVYETNAKSDSATRPL